MNRTPALHGLGGRIGTDLWRQLLRDGVRVDHPAGHTLLRQGDPGTHVIALASGLVKVSRLEADGTELLLAARGPGEVLGEIAALDHRPRSATVVTLRRTTTFTLPTAAFRRFIGDHDLYDQLVVHVLERLREGEDIRAELVALPLGRRLARTLVRLAHVLGSPSPDGVVVELGLSQHELARAIGASRSPVAAELAQLRLLGVVRTSPRQLLIRDMRRLEALADGREELGPNASASA